MGYTEYIRALLQVVGFQTSTQTFDLFLQNKIRALRPCIVRVPTHGRLLFVQEPPMTIEVSCRVNSNQPWMNPEVLMYSSTTHAHADTSTCTVLLFNTFTHESGRIGCCISAFDDERSKRVETVGSCSRVAQKKPVNTQTRHSPTVHLNQPEHTHMHAQLSAHACVCIHARTFIHQVS